MGPTLVADLPEVLDAVRINDWSETVIKYKDKSFIEDGFKQADSTFFNIFSIPLIQGDPQTALAAPHTLVMTKTTARKIFGNKDPMVSFFLDEDFEELYSEDKRTGSLALVFSILAILIASLGLFGLTSFTVEQRTKEIGIRKVNGASGRTIILLLLKEIALLVGIATLIAWAAGYIFMKGWLQNFYFRISLSPVDFLFSLLIVLAITWLTISYRSFKAAKTNPAQALKYE